MASKSSTKRSSLNKVSVVGLTSCVTCKCICTYLVEAQQGSRSTSSSSMPDVSMQWPQTGSRFTGLARDLGAPWALAANPSGRLSLADAGRTWFPLPCFLLLRKEARPGYVCGALGTEIIRVRASPAYCMNREASFCQPHLVPT